MPEAVQLQLLGLRPYREVWELQRQAQQALIEGHGHERLIICQHPPVITLGRSANSANILASPELLLELGVEALEIERGGDVSWHDPGQLVAYPILRLSKRRTDVGWYMRSLEEVIIRLLAEYGIQGERIPGRTGVWTSNSVQSEQRSSEESFPRKIASIGVRISRWCTLHGFSVNIRPYVLANGSSCVTLINPCGFDASLITFMQQERCDPKAEISIESLQDALSRHFSAVFECLPVVE